MNQTLLVELLTEELPPKALVKLGDAFAAAIVNGLKSRDFRPLTMPSAKAAPSLASAFGGSSSVSSSMSRV